MLHLSHSAHNADQRHYAESIDNQAEREAAALQWLEENLDIEFEKPRYRVLAAHAQAAAELGLSVKKLSRYPRHASWRAHRQISDAFAGRAAHDRVIRERDITTRVDRERRAARRAARVALLQQLDLVREVSVPRKGVGRLVGAAERTICTAIQKGELPIVRTGNERRIPVSALKAFLCRRVA